MAKAALVDTQINDGRRIVRQLEADGYQLDSALWLYDSEKDKWILLIATPLIVTNGPKEAYTKIKESLDKVPSRLRTHTIDLAIISPSHKILELLKSSATATELVKKRSVFVSGSSHAGQIVEDAFIYRLGWSARKAAPKKAAKRATAKRATARKAAPKKAAKKTTAKGATVRKAAPKKATAKKAPGP